MAIATCKHLAAIRRAAKARVRYIRVRGKALRLHLDKRENSVSGSTVSNYLVVRDTNRSQVEWRGSFPPSKFSDPGGRFLRMFR